MISQRQNFKLPLGHLAAAWGFSAGEWLNNESLERIELVNDQFNRDQAANLTLPLLNELFAVFQDSLVFTISIGELPVFEYGPDMTEQTIIDLQNDTKRAPTVRLYFRINKSRLAELYFSDISQSITGSKHPYLYLEMDRLVDYFKNCRLEDLEDLVWKQDKNSTVLFLVPDCDSLIGPRFGILGGQYITIENASEIQKWPQGEINLAGSSYQVCRGNLKWQEAWLNFLTPWHLYVMDKGRSPSELTNICKIHFGDAFLLYTADLTYYQIINGSSVRFSRYSTPDKKVEVEHKPGSTAIEITQEPDELIEILDWIYDPQWPTSDRLTLAQLNIVDQLNLVEASDRFDMLFKKAGTIHKNIDWHWETFTQDKIKSYMGVVKDLEEYLLEVTNGYSANIAAIQKTLTDSMLAAVGIWIGSFIASLFDKPFNPFILQTGLIAYALYVFFFPLLYNMIQQWKGFKSYQDQISVRKARFLECLPSSKIDEIWKAWKIEEIKSRFESNFWWTVGIYSVVIVASVLAAIFLPGWVIYSISQLATPTPPVPPTIIPTPIILPTPT